MQFYLYITFLLHFSNSIFIFVYIYVIINLEKFFISAFFELLFFKEDNIMTRTAKRRIKKTWNRVSGLILIIATLVAIFCLTCFLGSFGGKIVMTQLRMAHYHSEIKDLESSRDYYQDLANAAEIIEQIKAYQAQADNADQNIQKDFEARKALHDSSDPVVAFAAKNDFEFSKLLLGLGELLLVAVFLVFMYKFFVQIIKVEKAIVDFMLKALFFMVGSLFAFVANVCFAVSRFFSSPKKQNVAKRK